eukprot:3733956-Pleurochrysis_carterae.AAC.1
MQCSRLLPSSGWPSSQFVHEVYDKSEIHRQTLSSIRSLPPSQMRLPWSPLSWAHARICRFWSMLPTLAREPPREAQ